MKNIYQKLHQACLNAGGVKKGEKVKGMHFNPLLHDAVQEVAVQALLDERLYPMCSYKTDTHDSFVMVTCYMRIHDVDSDDVVEMNGCSAMGGLDKFGTGQAMSYSRKYAFLNLLNLKTGIKDDDGYETKLFKEQDQEYKKIPKQNGKKNIKLDMDQFNINQIKAAINKINDAYALRDFKKDHPEIFDPNRMSMREYRTISDLWETRLTKLNQQGVN